MKKLLVPFSSFVLAVILFTSCGNSSKLAFTKRHYRSGYYVNSVGRVHTIATRGVKAPLKTTYQTTSVPIVSTQSKVAENSPATPSKIQHKIAAKPFAEKEQVSNTASATSVYLAHNTSVQNTWFNDDVMGSSGDGNHGRNSASVPFVVIVIFAILIPPLGVGLMYGIDSYFWIDLILTLLFYFPGMIFALVVVLM